jgi:hypothetical protein
MATNAFCTAAILGSCLSDSELPWATKVGGDASMRARTSCSSFPFRASAEALTTGKQQRPTDAVTQLSTSEALASKYQLITNILANHAPVFEIHVDGAFQHGLGTFKLKGVRGRQHGALARRYRQVIDMMHETQQLGAYGFQHPPGVLRMRRSNDTKKASVSEAAVEALNALRPVVLVHHPHIELHRDKDTSEGGRKQPNTNEATPTHTWVYIPLPGPPVEKFFPPPSNALMSATTK